MKKYILFPILVLAIAITLVQAVPAIACETGEDGLTPGFWKNHLGEWAVYETTWTFAGVFGVGPSITLEAAINAKGGGENALMRHAVAALLNASHPDVHYPMTAPEVVAAVQNAYATGDFEGTKDMFEGYNQTDFDFYEETGAKPPHPSHPSHPIHP